MSEGLPTSPRLLVVCTANRCRSPLGAAILRRELDGRGLGASVGSAGTATVDGESATDAACEAAAKAGLNLDAHRTRQVTPELVAHSDLVLCMEPRHVTEVVGAGGGRLDRTFTVPELAALVDERLGDASPAGWADRLEAVGRDRDPVRALAAPAVEDPTGGSLRRHKATVRDLERWLSHILDAVVTP